jgi:hypothetical protein
MQQDKTLNILDLELFPRNENIEDKEVQEIISSGEEEPDHDQRELGMKAKRQMANLDLL